MTDPCRTSGTPRFGAMGLRARLPGVRDSGDDIRSRRYRSRPQRLGTHGHSAQHDAVASFFYTSCQVHRRAGRILIPVPVKKAAWEALSLGEVRTKYSVHALVLEQMGGSMSSCFFSLLQHMHFFQEFQNSRRQGTCRPALLSPLSRRPQPRQSPPTRLNIGLC
jgi:hypothetical protein